MSGSPPNLQDEYLTRPETAKLLRVKQQTLALWACVGHGPKFIRVGRGPRGACRYSRREVETWVASRSFSSTTEADSVAAGAGR
jgi:hypothetical protein